MADFSGFLKVTEVNTAVGKLTCVGLGFCRGWRWGAVDESHVSLT